MEVTREMIEAVKAHELAESRRKEKEARDERLRLYEERGRRIMAKAMEGARKVIPGLTEKQFDDLLGVFYDYVEDQEGRG